MYGCQGTCLILKIIYIIGLIIIVSFFLYNFNICAIFIVYYVFTSHFIKIYSTLRSKAVRYFKCKVMVLKLCSNQKYGSQNISNKGCKIASTDFQQMGGKLPKMKW